IYPGNYDDYMAASMQAQAQLAANNAKAKERVAELQEFVRRFSANKSKARQVPADSGTIKWAEHANIGYMPQDTYTEFEQDMTVFEWMTQWGQAGDDDQ
ncbi:unnamed protein product, partial [Darwinula stevensoni]